MITVRHFIKSLHRAWGMDEWLKWPPDTFAMTSLLLGQTGAYRCSVEPPRGGAWPMEPRWKDKLAEGRAGWLSWAVRETTRLPEFLRREKDRLEANWDVEISALKSLNRLDSAAGCKAWEVCQALLALHALADETCAGFGTPSGNRWSDKASEKALHCIANVLLAKTGSLSRLPTSVARVLPKLRTPSVGMTLRSLSHHVTVHQTEVEILWRSMPWPNIDENTLNVMVVPWPFRFEPTWFLPSGFATPRPSDEHDRYFHYTGESKPFAGGRLLALLEEAELSVGRVHLVVFPELALTEENFAEILNALAEEKDRDKVPMVLSGIRSREGGDLASNKVVLATFFAGKWYQMEHSKHHRWKLDKRQIRQYNLAGVLPSRERWWEAIDLPPRQLTLLAPSSWLTLCPLICEDLARLEPVSEVIRGVGPTLLVTVLLDGPQLRHRWPSRYASVLADDPGSSVLTVSSLGMAERSVSTDGEQGSRAVALWKDQVTGWETIEVAARGDAVVLTLSAEWVEEVSADGRGDEGSAAVFVLSGIHPLTKSTAETATKAQPREYRSSDREDMIEITTFSYFVDGAIDSECEVVDELRAWILDEPSTLKERVRAGKGLHERTHPRPGEATYSARTTRPSREDFDPFVRWTADAIKEIRRSASGGSRSTTPEALLASTVDFASQVLTRLGERSFLDGLECGSPFGEPTTCRVPEVPASVPKSRAVRIFIYGCLAMLWAVHKRLSGRRRRGRLDPAATRLLTRVEGILRERHDRVWYDAIARFDSEEAGSGPVGS